MFSRPMLACRRSNHHIPQVPYVVRPTYSYRYCTHGFYVFIVPAYTGTGLVFRGSWSFLYEPRGGGRTSCNRYS
jgi:hypothetical protein